MPEVGTYEFVAAEEIQAGTELSADSLSHHLGKSNSGYTVELVECFDYESYDMVTIHLCAIDKPKKVESAALEFDWSKFDVEIGGTLDDEDFKEGFVKTKEFTSHVWLYEYVIEFIKL